MKLLVDTHTHTVLSGHAFSTLKENAASANKNGLEGFVLSDHGPALDLCQPQYTLSTAQRYLPQVIEGVRMVRGVECNIVDYSGKLDVEDRHLKFVEFAIAGLHDTVIPRGNAEQNTAAVLGAIHNPYIDVIAHPGNANYPIHAEEFVRAVKAQNKLVEINNHSFAFRRGSLENCSNIIRLCKKHDVRIVVCSDAHYCDHVGILNLAIDVLRDCEFPLELIASRTLATFLDYLQERQKRIV